VLSVKNTVIDHIEGDDDDDEEEEQTAGDSCKQYVSPSSEHPATDRSKNSKYSEGVSEGVSEEGGGSPEKRP